MSRLWTGGGGPPSVVLGQLAALPLLPDVEGDVEGDVLVDVLVDDAEPAPDESLPDVVDDSLLDADAVELSAFRLSVR
jgi:hypothetical protein